MVTQDQHIRHDRRLLKASTQSINLGHKNNEREGKAGIARRCSRAIRPARFIQYASTYQAFYFPYNMASWVTQGRSNDCVRIASMPQESPRELWVVRRRRDVAHRAAGGRGVPTPSCTKASLPCNVSRAYFVRNERCSPRGAITTKNLPSRYVCSNRDVDQNAHAHP